MATQNSCTCLDSDTRYLTNRFAAISLSEAQRLAEIDCIPFERVQQTCKVKLLHVHPSNLWAWWSDGRLTTGLGLDPDYSPNELSVDAVNLIHKVSLSTCLRPACGWEKIAQIKQIHQRRRLAVGPMRGNYRPEKLTQLEIESVSGERSYLYTFFSAEGQKDYFSHEVTTSLPIERLKKSTINQVSTLIEKVQQAENLYHLKLKNVA